METRKRNDPDANDPEARLALILLRYSQLLDQGELARRARIAQSQISLYEQGDRAASREVLEKAATAVDFPLHLLAPLLRTIRSFRDAAKSRYPADRFFVEGLSAELNAVVRMAADVILEPLFMTPAHPEPMDAETLWVHLEECTAPERRMLIEELEEYWSPELAARVATESVKAAPDHPEEAQELAELARLIASRAAVKPEGPRAEGRAEKPCSRSLDEFAPSRISFAAQN